MRLRKTWLQYCIGILYLFFVSVLFSRALFQESAAMGLLGGYTRIGLVCAVFVLCIVAAVGGRRLMEVAANTKPISGRALLLWEVVFTLCLFAGAAIFRWILLRENGWQLTGGQEYLNSGLLPYSSNNGVGLYAGLLAKAVMLTGLPQITVILLQTVLQLVGMAFFYVGIRCLCGRTAALAALAVPAFAPAVAADCFRAGPQSFLFMTVSAGLCASGIFLRQLQKGRSGGALAAGVAALGLLLGMLLYLDRAGLALLTVPAAGLLFVPRGTGRGKRTGLLLLLLLWTCLSLAGCFYFKAWLQSGSLQTAFMEWQKLWDTAGGLGVRQFLPAQAGWLLLVLMGGAFLCGIGNCAAPEEFWTPCTFFWAGILLFYGMESLTEGNPYELLNLAAWAVAAGAGAGFLTQPLEEAAVLREQAADREKTEDGVRILPLEEVENAPERKKGMTQKSGNGNSQKVLKKKKRRAGQRAHTKDRQPQTVMPASFCSQPQEKETAENPGVPPVKEAKRETQPYQTEAEGGPLQKNPQILEKTVHFIPNPLPVPKKHVKREMDYAFVPEEDAMKFDLDDLTENDDFDLL